LVLHRRQPAFWSGSGSTIGLSRFGEWLREARDLPAFVVCDDVDTEQLFVGTSELLLPLLDNRPNIRLLLVGRYQPDSNFPGIRVQIAPLEPGEARSLLSRLVHEQPDLVAESAEWTGGNPGAIAALAAFLNEISAGRTKRLIDSGRKL